MLVMLVLVVVLVLIFVLVLGQRSSGVIVFGLHKMKPTSSGEKMTENPLCLSALHVP